MRHRPSPVPRRLRILDALQRLGTPLADLDEEGLRRLRTVPEQSSALRRALSARVTGAVVGSVSITTATATGRHGDIPLRVYRPTGLRRRVALPVVVFFHGGGWTIGATAAYDPLCTHLADAADVVIVSVDYRLAPEHPAPTGVEDAVDATSWIEDHVEQFGGDASRMAVMGDSAGGNLSAVVTQTMRDTGGPALRHQTLIYPSVDASTLRYSKIVNSGGPILSRRDTDAFFAYYLGTGADALTADDPRISPLFGDLHGLPPALVQTADLDPLRDEGLAYADALRQHGSEVVVTNYPRAAHGFASIPGLTPHVWAHRREIVTELRRHLHPAPVSGVDTGGTDSETDR